MEERVGVKRASALRRAATLLCGVLLMAGLAMQDRAVAAESFKPFKMKSLEGPQKSLSDMLGKATLVVFFFPTCQFCNVAMPEIQKFYDAYKDRGLSVVFINVVPQEERLIPEWRSSTVHRADSHRRAIGAERLQAGHDPHPLSAR